MALKCKAKPRGPAARSIPLFAAPRADQAWRASQYSPPWRSRRPEIRGVAAVADIFSTGATASSRQKAGRQRQQAQKEAGEPHHVKLLQFTAPVFGVPPWTSRSRRTLAADAVIVQDVIGGGDHFLAGKHQGFACARMLSNSMVMIFILQIADNLRPGDFRLLIGMPLIFLPPGNMALCIALGPVYAENRGEEMTTSCSPSKGRFIAQRD